MLRYVASEYALTVNNGEVVNVDEYREMTAFTRLAHARVKEMHLAHPGASALLDELAALERAVEDKKDPRLVNGRIVANLATLKSEFGIASRFLPASAPNLQEGERVYRQNCAVCHGLSGNGRGPAAGAFNPRPADFTDPEFMSIETPADFFNVINVGVAATVMPAWNGILSGREIWNTVFYLWKFHLPSGAVKRGKGLYRKHRAQVTLPDKEAFVNSSDADLASRFETTLSEAARRDLVSFLRSKPSLQLRGGETYETQQKETLATIRGHLNRVRQEYEAGNQAEALQAAVNAYLDGFEKMELSLASRAPALNRSLEKQFGTLREELQAAAPTERIEATIGRIEEGLMAAEHATQTRLTGLATLGQSFVIILREGFEVMLILAALATYLIRVGQKEKTLLLYSGAGAAIAVSLVLAWLADLLFSLEPASQEILEGVTMLIAAAVLFYVSYWILSKIEADKWQRYIKGKAEQAVKAGSAWGLGGLGFLVVFREGVETVLFYKSLSFGAPGAGHLIAIGFGLGCIALLFASIAIFQLGLRLPLRSFFMVTSAMLYCMVFNFVGKGIYELQAVGVISTTPLTYLPRIPLLGIYPTLEGLTPQMILIGLAVIGIFWLRLFPSRRLQGEAPRPAPLQGSMQPTPAHEQLLAIQELAGRLHTHLESYQSPQGEEPDRAALRSHITEWRNLAGQIQAAAQNGRQTRSTPPLPLPPKGGKGEGERRMYT